MSKLKLTSVIALALLTSLSASTCFADENETASTLKFEESICQVSRDWFAPSGGIVEPNPEATLNSNCDFHQISWHYFLWLTEKQGGKLRFENFMTDIALEGKKDLPNSLPHVFQAGSNGILVDQNGRAGYTSMYVNDTFAKFVDKHQLMTIEGFEQADKNLTFPNGAIELKAAWKIVNKAEKQALTEAGFYVTEKWVKKLYTNKFDTVDLVNGQEQSDFIPETVVLTGLHIAVWVKDHPEAIWATFESRLNSPDLVHGAKIDSSVAEKNYLYYKHSNTQQDCNLLPATSYLTLDETSQTLTPITQVCRVYQNGGGSSNNQNNIRTLNASAHAYPKTPAWLRNYYEVGAVWFDAEKLPQRLAQAKQSGPMLLNWAPVSTQTQIDPLMAGSNQLSSSVIETFTQSNIAENNCFACHNTASQMADDESPKIDAKTINLSHILKLNYIEIKNK